MSRTKGSSAQPGPQRWRQQPEQDANAYGQAGEHYPESYTQLGHAGPAPHFPQNAFRHLGAERLAPQARPALSSQGFERPVAAQPAAGHDRLSQRLHQAAGQRPATQPGWPPQADPSGYDLAHYAPERPAARGAPHDLGGGQPHDPYANQSYVDAAAEGWTGAGWNGQADYGEPPMDGAHYADPMHGDPSEDYGYDPEDEEPQAVRRGPRSYVVVGALVGAILAGGGLAYAYKSLGSSGDTSTPIVRAERGPAKAKPADPGGREIAHTDKKFINRLTEDRSSGPRFGDSGNAAASADADGGPRKVTTLVVNRDGSMTPPNPVVPLPQNGAASPVVGGGVPGMVIDGLGPRPQGPQLRGSSGVTESQAPVATPAKPKIIARATPAPEPAERTEDQVPRKPVQREAVAAVASAAPKAVAPAAAGNGFVPVLTSQKSRMDALKAFADMQQKYTDVFQNRTPDVREVDLGNRGVWHRLVLGPPASREAASNVCTQLKAHGYSGCWVVAY